MKILKFKRKLVPKRGKYQKCFSFSEGVYYNKKDHQM